MISTSLITVTVLLTRCTQAAWIPHPSSVYVKHLDKHVVVSKLSNPSIRCYCPISHHKLPMSRNAEDDSSYYDSIEDDVEYEDNDYNRRSSPRRNTRRKNTAKLDNLSTSTDDQGGFDIPSPFGRKSGLRLPESVSKAVLAGVFVLGIGTGVTVDSQINTNPKDLASRDAIDIAAPNPRLCTTYGASAIALDQRVFVSFNPFNVYVAQADVKPACVLRPANVVSILQNRGLIKEQEVRACKANMNTWAFVGDLEDYPQLSCVYQSEDAQNEFLSNPKLGIGEDVYDDDRQRAVVDAILKKTGKGMKKDDLAELEQKNQ